MDREPASSKTFIRCPECLRKLPGHKYQCSLKNQGKMDWLLPDELNNRSGHELKKTGNRTFTQGITDKQIARRDFLKKISLVGVGAGLLGAGYLVGDAKAIPAPSIGSTIEPGSMESPASYLVFLDGSTILTRNGDTGINTYSNTDMGIILNNVSQELYNASGGGIYTKSGTFNMNTDVALDFQNNKSIMIKVSGMFATIIKYNGTGFNPFFFQNSIGSGNASGLQGVAASLNGSVEIDDMQLLFPSPVVYLNRSIQACRHSLKP